MPGRCRFNSHGVVAPPVLVLGDDRLHKVSQRCKFACDGLDGGASDAEVQSLKIIESELHARLKTFRQDRGFGRAIAAPQINRPLRMIACNLADCKNSASLMACPAPSQPFTLCNPEMIWRSEETFTLWDDCMSFPELLVRVARCKSVSLRWRDTDGREYTWEKLGLEEAELLQHEYDHLDGVLAVDRALDGEKDIVKKEDFKQNEELYLKRVDWAPQKKNLGRS